MRKILSLPFFAVILLAMSGCMMSAEEAFTLKEGEAVTIIGIKGDFDGETIGDRGDFCDFMFKDELGNPIQKYRRDIENGYVMIKSQEEKVSLSTIGCLSNRVLYNKIRRKEFSNLYFTPQKGYVNYLGTLKFNWIPDSVKVGDFLFSGSGNMTEDEGTLVMTLNEDVEDVKSYVRTVYPEGGDRLIIKKVHFNNNAYFIK